jgi:hypothetical protein
MYLSNIRYAFHHYLIYAVRLYISCHSTARVFGGCAGGTTRSYCHMHSHLTVVTAWPPDVLTTPELGSIPIRSMLCLRHMFARMAVSGNLCKNYQFLQNNLLFYPNAKFSIFI